MKVIESVSWDDFDQFEDIIDKYMPMRGEGDTKASQAVTAVNKLIYKWYNDGDVFDNTHGLKGWANDLSSYANWLYFYVSESRKILKSIYHCKTEDDYENLLWELANAVLNESVLEKLNNEPSDGSIYDDNDGPFEFQLELSDAY